MFSHLYVKNGNVSEKKLNSVKNLGSVMKTKQNTLFLVNYVTQKPLCVQITATKIWSLREVKTMSLK